MARRVLHILSQRPALTGSGVTLDALVRCADTAGWEQDVVVGVPEDDARPEVGGLPQQRIHPLRFPHSFPVPGMSDVMPYRSTRYRDMTLAQVDEYIASWKVHLQDVAQGERPDVIHSHHTWLLSSTLKEVFPQTPVVLHGHGTGLRQLELCPHLRERVIGGCRGCEALLVLHRQHADLYSRRLGFPRSRVHVVGGGYRDEVFFPPQTPTSRGPTLLYAGKLSNAKGVPWLLEAVERTIREIPGLTLHIAGDGSGSEAAAIRTRVAGLAGTVVDHGRLDQRALADVMRLSKTFVLPSFFEGLPLVLVEALACGQRLVATALPGVTEEIAAEVGDALELVPLPRLEVDVPHAGDLPPFVDRLAASIVRSLRAPDLVTTAGFHERFERFTWQAVFSRIEAVWRSTAAN